MPEQPTGLADDRSLLETLIAIDTTSGQPCNPALDVICNRLEDAGCRIERVAGPADGRDNLVAVAGPVDAGGGLSLSGHIDCVPAGQGWSSDPFTLTERDACWFGRGSCDMKGFVALATNLLCEATDLCHPLAMILTSDEELGSVGAASLLQSANQLPPLPTSCVVGEPTSLSVVRMHKGHLKFTIRVHGKTGHTGTPASGLSAIDGVRHVLAALDEARLQLEAVRTATSSAFATVPSPVLSAVRLNAGHAWNVIPDEATVDCGLRVLPDQDAGAVLAQVRQVVETAMGNWSGTWALEIFNDNPPMCTQRDADIDRSCRALVGQTDDIGVSYCSDGGHLGRLGLDCVLFGPGDIARAHRPDEYVPIQEMAAARTHLKTLIDAMCGGGS
ncbi:MAG: M20/M25/M40 family metallo-hydrolase [Phycisphaerales bacterium]|nr:M20/M25/M40 family metallo-hydrolase [Phycisphaerales bacterium]